MKHLIAFFLLIFYAVKVEGQVVSLDSLIDIGIEQYNKGEKRVALKTWEKVEKSASDTSSTYGTVLGNILYFYIQEKSEKKLLEYYNKIIFSKLNDKDRRYNKLGEPFKNYRYHATMSLASYFANQKNFRKALHYINNADNRVIYENSSLTAVRFQKVDLAFWKSRLYKDLGREDSAFYVLLKRAFEYDYQNIYKNWATASVSNDELELAEEILGKDISKGKAVSFKSELDVALNNLKIKEINGVHHVSLNFRSINYDIQVYQRFSTPEEYKSYLEQSFFYRYLINRV